MKKALSCVLALTLCVSLASCTLTSPSTVMSVNDTEIAAGKYLYYQMAAVSSAKSQVADSEKSIFGQQIEGKAAEEWIHTRTLEDVKMYVFIDKALADKSIKLTEDEMKNIDSQLDSMWDVNEKTYSANGIGKQSLRSVIEDSVEQEKYFTEVFLKDTKNAVSDEDAKKYYEDNFSRVAKLTLPSADVSGKKLSTENAKKIDDFAAEIQKAVQGGKALDEALAKEYAQKICEVTGYTNDDDFITRIFTSNVISNKVTDASGEVAKAATSAKVGDSGIATEDESKVVWCKKATIDKPEEYDDIKDAVKETVQREALASEIKAVTESYTITEDAAAVKTYSPKKAK